MKMTPPRPKRSSKSRVLGSRFDVRLPRPSILHPPSSSLALLLPLLLLTLPAAVQAQFTYTTNNGAITITGYTGPGGAVTIPSTINGLPVTGIGDSAFEGCTSLISVTVPRSVTSIGNYAFYDCYSLTNVTIGTNVTSIGESAFGVCTSLTSITIPDSVSDIGGGCVRFLHEPDQRHNPRQRH